MTDLYGPAFYEIIRPGVRSSAAALVPTMHDIYRTLAFDMDPHPSLVDVGCGEGWWAYEWRMSGYANDVTGIDGPWPGAGRVLDRSAPPDDDVPGLDFLPMRLDAMNPDIVAADPQYDIALCLEVAEHLDDPDPFLGWLRGLAPIIFFSAAVPGQPGNGHVSCRWQADWAESFKEVGWYTHDPRPMIWGNPNIEWWYRQNLFVAWDPTSPAVTNTLHDEPIMSMIHPELWDVR